MNPRRRRPPAAGKGRLRGSRNKKTKAQKLAEARERTEKVELEKDVSEFFRKLTVENYKWRENMRKKMEDEITGTDPRMVELCLKYALGTPLKQQPPQASRKALYFVGKHGLPWEHDPMAEQERKAIAALEARRETERAAAEQKLQGLREDQPDDEDEGESPEVVRG